MAKLFKINVQRNAATTGTTAEGEQVTVYHSKFNISVSVADQEGIFLTETFNRQPLSYINDELKLFDIELSM